VAHNSEEFVVTPWEVRGKVNYEYLIKVFGVKPLTDQVLNELKEVLGGELHLLLRRKIFFAHRGLEWAIKDIKEGRRLFLYTGRGPSGPMHVGHLLPFIFTKWLQDKLSINVYIEITDDEKFLHEPKASYEEIRKWAYDNMLDIIAVGFDPNKTFIFLDTEYMGRVYPLLVKVAKRINFSEVSAIFGFTQSTNIGLIFFPTFQIAVTFFEKRRSLIPSAIDQDPYWRLQHDIAKGLGFYKASTIYTKFLPPLTGPTGKMSTSNPDSALFLTDDDKTIYRKIMKAYSGGQPTAELHRKYGGNPDIDVAFQWLKFLFEEDDNKLKKIEEDYRSGALLTGELKLYLYEKVVKFMERHRERREKAKELIRLYMYEGELAREMWSRDFSKW